MLPLLIDQDLNHDILRGLLLRVPDLDFVTAHQANLSNVDDSTVLKWAAQHSRVVVTHDRRTMPSLALQLTTNSESFAGVIIVSRKLPLGQAIHDLEIIVLCSPTAEWENVIMYLPL